MARIRTVKPSFFTSEDVRPVSFRARLTWVGLWTYCDDHGRGKDNVMLIKAAVWPLELSLEDVEDDLHELAKRGRIVRYRHKGQRYLAVTNWHFHQSINRPGKSGFPPPPKGRVNVPEPGEKGHCNQCFREFDTPGVLTEEYVSDHGGNFDKDAGQPAHGAFSEQTLQISEDSVRTHGGLTSGKERKGREGKTPYGGFSPDRTDLQTARDSERSRKAHGAFSEIRCLDHEGDDDPPRCGACERERRRAEQLERESRIDKKADELRKCRENKLRAIADCGLCDDQGYAGTALCNHDPAAADRAKRGRDLVNRALAEAKRAKEPQPDQPGEPSEPSEPGQHAEPSDRDSSPDAEDQP